MDELRKKTAKIGANHVELEHYELNNGTTGFAYTASERNLQHYLGDKYIPIIGKTPDEIREQLRQNIHKIVSLKNIAGNSLKKINEFHKNQLVSILEKERTFDPRYAVFYHGTGGSTGFLYDILTTIRQFLRGKFDENSVTIRAIDEKFKEIETPIAAFEKFQGDDRNQGIMDLLIPTTLSLFGNIDRNNENCLGFYLSGSSVNAVYIDKLLNALELEIGGIKFSIEKYKAKYQEIFAIDYANDARLYQIMIAPEFVDHKLAYAAVSYGHPVYPMEGRLQEYLLNLKSTNYNPQTFKDAPPDLQARLFFKPQLAQNSDIMKIFTYHRGEQVTPEKLAAWDSALKQMIAQDISAWLEKTGGKVANHVLSDTHGPNLHDVFKEKYKDATGIEYREENFLNEQELSDTLNTIVKTNDISGLTALMEKHSLVDLLRTSIVKNLIYGQAGNSTIKDLKTYDKAHNPLNNKLFAQENFMKHLVATFDAQDKQNLAHALALLSPEEFGIASNIVCQDRSAIYKLMDDGQNKSLCFLKFWISLGKEQITFYKNNKVDFLENIKAIKGYHIIRLLKMPDVIKHIVYYDNANTNALIDRYNENHETITAPLIVEYISHPDVDMVKFLIEKGANLELKDSEGDTPLAFAEQQLKSAAKGSSEHQKLEKIVELIRNKLSHTH